MLRTSRFSTVITTTIFAILAVLIALFPFHNTQAASSSQTAGVKYSFQKGEIDPIEPGQDDAPITVIGIETKKQDAYLNTVTVAVSNKFGTEAPWEAFESLSIWKGSIKVYTVAVNKKELWTLNNGVYEAKIFTGNVKLKAQQNISLTASLSVAKTAKNETWKFMIPEGGIVVWTALTGPVKYGKGRDHVKFAIKPYTVSSATLNTAFFTTSKPKLAGKATETSSVRVAIATSGIVLYDSGSISVKNGRWSHQVATAIPNGSYTLVIYDEDEAVLLSRKITIAEVVAFVPLGTVLGTSTMDMDTVVSTLRSLLQSIITKLRQ